jgi:hypothetical protein
MATVRVAALVMALATATVIAITMVNVMEMTSLTVVWTDLMK